MDTTDYSTPEAVDNLNHPLISLNAKGQRDFVKALYLKLALKGAKTSIYHLKELVIVLREKGKNQAKEINRLKELNKKLKEQWRK